MFNVIKSIHLVNISNNNDKELMMNSKAEKVKNECQNVKVNIHSIKSNDIENDLIKCSNILNVDLVIIGRRKLGHWERLTTDEGKSLSSHLANVIAKPLIVVKFFKD